MPITIQWDDADKTILLCQFENPWTWDELYAALEDMRQYLHEGDGPVDIILDMERGKTIPPNAMAQFSRFSGITHPRARLRVVAGGGGMAASLMSIFIRVYRNSSDQYHLVNSREQAYDLIHEKRQT